MSLGMEDASYNLVGVQLGSEVTKMLISSMHSVKIIV